MAREHGLELRKIVLHIMDNMSHKEETSLQYLYGIPDEYKENIVKTFEYLEKNQDRFSEASPEGLIDLVRNLGRSDLVKSVTAKVQAYSNVSQQATPTGEPLSHHQPLMQNPELKRHFESTLKLCPLYQLHIRALEASLVDIARADPSHPNVDNIRQLLKEAEENFKTGTDRLIRASRIVGFKPSKHSTSQLVYCTPQQLVDNEEHRGKGGLRGVKSSIKHWVTRQRRHKTTRLSPAVRARSRSLDYGLNDDHYETIDTETVDTEDDEEATHRPQERETTSEEEEEGSSSVMVVTSRASLVTAAATAALPSTVADKDERGNMVAASSTVAEKEEEVDESKETGGSVDSGIMMVPILPSAPCYDTKGDCQDKMADNNNDDDDPYEPVNLYTQ